MEHPDIMGVLDFTEVISIMSDIDGKDIQIHSL